jgi:hypothetical protein
MRGCERRTDWRRPYILGPVSVALSMVNNVSFCHDFALAKAQERRLSVSNLPCPTYVSLSTILTGSCNVALFLQPCLSFNNTCLV